MSTFELKPVKFYVESLPIHYQRLWNSMPKSQQYTFVEIARAVIDGDICAYFETTLSVSLPPIAPPLFLRLPMAAYLAAVSIVSEGLSENMLEIKVIELFSDTDFVDALRDAVFDYITIYERECGPWGSESVSREYSIGQIVNFLIEVALTVQELDKSDDILRRPQITF